MSYDKGPRFNDTSALGWAAAADQVSKTVINTLEGIVAFQNEQRAIEAKKQEVFDLTWNEQSLAQSSTLQATVDELEEQGVENSLIKDAQTIQKDLMNGIGKEGDDDYKMGSIEAATILATRTGLTKEDREEYQNIVNEANSNLKNTLKSAGVIMTDVESILKYKGTPGPGREEHWGGNNFEEQLGTQVAGFAMSNMPIPGVSTTNKSFSRDSNGNQILLVESKIDKNSPILKKWGIKMGEIDPVTNKPIKPKNSDKSNTWKFDTDGNVIMTFKKDLSVWDGDMLVPTMAGTDYKTIMTDQKILSENGKDLSESFKKYLPSTVIRGSGKRQQVVTNEFIDMKRIDNIMGEALIGRLKDIYLLPPLEKKAYMEQRLGLGDVDIKKFATLSETQQNEWLKIAEIGKMREQFGLTSSESIEDLTKRINPITNKKYTPEQAKKYLNQTPGYNLVRREIDEELLQTLESNGVQGYSVGEFAYFEQSEPKDMAIPTSGYSGPSQSTVNKQNAIARQYTRLSDPDSTSTVYSSASAPRMSAPKARDRRLYWNGTSWVPQVYITVSADGVTGSSTWKTVANSQVGSSFDGTTKNNQEVYDWLGH